MKVISSLVKKAQAAFLLFLALVSSAAFAVPPTTVAELTDAISFTDIGLGVLAVTAGIIAFVMIKQAAVIVIGMLRKAR